jgi:hypothetical protein
LYYLRERTGKAARIREKTTGICAPGKAGSLVVEKTTHTKRKNKKSKIAKDA